MKSEELKELTSWENIMATDQAVEPASVGETAVIGICLPNINNFASAGVLVKRGEKFIFSQHTWISATSPDIPKIKFPLDEAVEAGEAEIVHTAAVVPELIAEWVKEQMGIYRVAMVAMDGYQYAMMKTKLASLGFTYENRKIKLVLQSDMMDVETYIDNSFRKHNIVYGDCKIMRWYTNNVVRYKSRYGMYRYQAIDESRKTEGFFAFAYAMTQHELLISKQEGDAEVDLYKKAKEFAIRIMDKPNQFAQELEIIPQLLKVLLDTKQ